MREETSGRRVIQVMYVVTIAVVGVFGYLVGLAIQPRLMELGVSEIGVGPLMLPVSPLNVAIIGMVLVGVGLTVAFGLVAVVSRYAD
ncbi:hypothetical protein [Salarchaeum sp. JOR-1]|uniref:DUF7520 family protein n=1 Tax=Salarchaeum sp. JOR-1 TaxID=2599399 RepID=UPI00119847FF|nr:hypothetical protein [Salarchaeum sp. JOR-1]QDX39660.1 hypothetical protein FQU85_01660 [Salarchaeum sp. JOR-1]